MSGRETGSTRKGAKGDRGIGNLLNARHEEIENNIFNGFRSLPAWRQKRILGQVTAFAAAMSEGSPEPTPPASKPIGKEKGEPTIPRAQQKPAVDVDERILPIAMVSNLRDMTRQDRATPTGQILLTVITVIKAAWRRCLSSHPENEGAALETWNSTIRGWTFDLETADTLSQAQIDEVKLSFLSDDAREKTLRRIAGKKGEEAPREPSPEPGVVTNPSGSGTASREGKGKAKK